MLFQFTLPFGTALDLCTDPESNWVGFKNDINHLLWSEDSQTFRISFFPPARVFSVDDNNLAQLSFLFI